MVTYGAAIQMKNLTETNGNLCGGNLEDIICTHKTHFWTSNMQSLHWIKTTITSLIMVLLKKIPKNTSIDMIEQIWECVILIKLEPRNNFPRKCLKSSRKLVISGKRSSPKCQTACKNEGLQYYCQNLCFLKWQKVEMFLFCQPHQE